MIPFLRERKGCEHCDEKFSKVDDLVTHMKNKHHHPVSKCGKCGKEFLHEKDRLHHVREENEKKWTPADTGR